MPSRWRSFIDSTGLGARFAFALNIGSSLFLGVVPAAPAVFLVFLVAGQAVENLDFMATTLARPFLAFNELLQWVAVTFA
ncbi:hypothetical protein ACMWP9_33870, partial [Escherichia coli]